MHSASGGIFTANVYLTKDRFLSGSAVGNNNQYVDTGLSYMTRRRQGNKEVAGSWLGRFPASLGVCHMTAAFHQLITR
jgi:hypothetical protein